MVEKRSREYLNDQMDKIDVDTVYYGFIYDDITDKGLNKWRQRRKFVFVWEQLL